ncbi:hypothetical protein BX600DRAFT_554941 [Xylariales sp. PMI_506]|nr:hypothetical protein BX600DRAFT_554941 [Xylariales sp. PMI_506]
MKKGFAFIDGLKDDRATRRKALSHAMKGKNFGKTHHRPSKLGQRSRRRNLRQTYLAAIDADQYHFELDSASGSPGLDSHVLCCKHLPIPFPIETTPLNRHTINQFFTFYISACIPTQLCWSVEQFMAYWMQVLFLDRTSYHCSLALMGTLNEVFFGQDLGSVESAYHLGQAVSLVNQTLETSGALSNSNITVVNFLVLRELMRGDQATAEVHLTGLKRMVDLRGGLLQLGDDTLALKISKTDLDYALHFGTSPLFNPDTIFEISLPWLSKARFVYMDLPYSQEKFSKIHPDLLQIILDVGRISATCNEPDNALKLNPIEFQELIVSVGYRLVRFRTLFAPWTENRLESAFHIGLVAFLTTLFVQFGRRRYLKYQLVGQCLTAMIDESIDELDDGMILWMLFIGGISVLAVEDKDNPWLSWRIHETAQRLGLKDWRGIQRNISKYPWIECLHGAGGKALWDSVSNSIDIL